MSTINRTTFRNTFEHGIDLGAPALADGLAGTGISLESVRRSDTNGDGVVSGRAELNRLFNQLDGLDDNGSSSSFLTGGQAGMVFRALVAAKQPTPYFGGEIARVAGDRVAMDGPNYGVSMAPTSPHPQLSGNDEPGVTRLDWLRGRNKCNVFVGDTLTAAGIQAPMVTMADGSLHYGRAETWPRREDLFDRVTDRSEIKVGDVIVRDYPGSGNDSAHVEIITGLEPFRSTGAHPRGAYERGVDLLAGTSYNAANRSFDASTGDQVYVLRPHQRIAE